MPVRPEAQMHEVQHRRRAGDLLKNLRVARRCGLEIGGFHWHGMDLLGAQGGVREQALAQMREIAVGVSGGGHALVDLQHVHAAPGQLLLGQVAQHFPRRVAAAHGEDEAAARGHGHPGLRSDEGGSRPGDRIGIGEHVDLHGGLLGTWEPGWPPYPTLGAAPVKPGRSSIFQPYPAGQFSTGVYRTSRRPHSREAEAAAPQYVVGLLRQVVGGGPPPLDVKLLLREAKPQFDWGISLRSPGAAPVARPRVEIRRPSTRARRPRGHRLGQWPGFFRAEDHPALRGAGRSRGRRRPPRWRAASDRARHGRTRGENGHGHGAAVTPTPAISSPRPPARRRGT